MVSNLAAILTVEIPVPKWSGQGVTFFKSKYNISKNLNFQNILTVEKFELTKFNGFLSVKLVHHVDHFILGLVFHKRPFADKTLIPLINNSNKNGFNVWKMIMFAFDCRILCFCIFHRSRDIIKCVSTKSTANLRR